MTLPVLIRKQQNIEHVTALKKFYSTFQQGINTMKALTNCEDIDCLGLSGDITDSEWNNQMEITVKKYFKAVKVCKYADGSCKQKYFRLSGQSEGTGYGFDENMFVFITPDGMKIRINPQIGGNGSKWLPVTVDVNGDKKPNTMGRDLFPWYLSKDGTLHPNYGEVYSEGNPNLHWKNNPSICGNINGNISGNPSGYGCTARIMEENWQMKY